MRVTVAICTWNRAALLRATLEHMTALQVPPGTEWELLVVDNNSTDGTAGTIASFDSRLPIRRVFEPEPGLAHARNCAMREASGDYILWTDDDVLVEPNWIAAYVAAFVRYPSAGFFGGVIRPWFPNVPPEWLRRGFDHVSSAYAALDLGPDVKSLSVGRLTPYGANMAFRLDEQRAFPFDPSLGRRPGSLVGGEEVDVFERMRSRAIEGWWIPDAVVRHFIPPERQTLRYVQGYYRGQGQLKARDAPQPERTLWGMPLWMLRAALKSEAQYRLTRWFGAPEQWVLRLRTASIDWGMLGRS